jgi:ABC-type transport system involved in cytochrome c biogenesis permease component
MKVALAFWVVLISTDAQAMGNQSATFWVGDCALALGGSSLAAVLAKASQLGQLLALLVIGMGAAAVWGLSRAPEYSTYATWINAASASCTAVSIYASRLALKLSRT